MLRELSVQNLALIEDARVELEAGFCVWTGETGAGKSLLLTALGLVLGEKASSDLVRTGKDEARAAAVFDVAMPALRSDVEAILGGPLDEPELIVTRRIAGGGGRSVAHVNGLPVSVATLRRLGERLLSIHGQHETRDLMDPDQHRGLLDTHAGHDAPLARYEAARLAHDTLRRRRQELRAASERRARERELLAFERDELASADPRPGEHEELVREAHRLAHAEELRAATAEGYNLLYEREGSVQEHMARVARRLSPLAEAVPELADAARDLERLAEESREVARSLRRFNKEWGDDPERLEEGESRLAPYRRLSARRRCPPDDLAARREQIESHLASIERDDADLTGLDAPLAAAWAEVRAAAADLTAARRRAAKGFARSVQSQLKELCLPEARLAVEIEPHELAEDPSAASGPEGGVDRVELVFTPNPGEDPRPLRRIASGGELARVALAIKTVLAGADGIPTIVFDEIDSGVGGRLGPMLGRKLAELGRHHQVVCVTHLPQMASFAAAQWVIRKQVERGRTRTTITRLDHDARVDELAAMLRGASAAEGTRQEAKAMLAEAEGGRR